ncbi:MAG: bifunctional [glutamate--ammonia ligase]-adenylyl-L-tyrosine phosphorylase/[glutamate--ammonia-ligase] adenylyltransferase, partial [Desulfomonile tiedjei]|nr:bifunctional [glutamate--ammonia ligase]-adenylyl-L-tyrosine phosphorylase/[glutamate--ammonia-ligase] adenylyltransferase [Desulfomonile tiedjei]
MELDDLTLYLNRNCSKLTELLHQFPDETRVRLLWEFLDSTNPRATAGRIEDLLDIASSETVASILEDRDLSPPFLTAVSGSRFLASILIRNPALLEPFFLGGGYLVRKTRQVKENELALRTAAAARTEDLDRILRLYKEEEYLRIGTGDLVGVADVQQVMGELSDLAAACTATAVRFHWKRLLEKHGLPPLERDGIGFVVMGMGKVSGRELNFSSDLDLIFLREPEEGRTGGPESVTVVKFYETLARSVTRSLSDITEDGFVLRVDLRLRPEGDKGELVPSLSNAVDYYLGWGRTWERAALMKAVPLAGDIELGNAFLEELEPFIYRKYLDYSTIEDMRGMKAQIESQLKRKPGVDIKLGQGGIREIEFFVQTLQLINAGRTPRVRSASTLEALALLRDTDLLDNATVAQLRSAYLFFRTTEHRIQITHQVQTHELPRTQEDQEE